MEDRRRGADLIADERNRQIEEEGYTVEHDAQHLAGQLARAAECYLWVNAIVTNEDALAIIGPPVFWPWKAEDWRPSADPIRNLVKAGALIAAEIDRQLRLR